MFEKIKITEKTARYSVCARLSRNPPKVVVTVRSKAYSAKTALMAKVEFHMESFADGKVALGASLQPGTTSLYEIYSPAKSYKVLFHARGCDLVAGIKAYMESTGKKAEDIKEVK